ncbi:MAG: cytochrome C oxidase subunit IV family protein [Thermoproteota archaeon]
MSAKISVAVFATLIAMTAGELALINLSLSASVIVTSLIGLAGVKASLIAIFFQDLKDEPRALSSVLLVGLGIAMLLMVITFLQVHPVHL